ncbi:MAG: tRNA (adenosine(37)-N6)-threonylcarbamoyltransferase complex ATPase subunit type 1 TsaE [Oceanobacter sp.]
MTSASSEPSFSIILTGEQQMLSFAGRLAKAVIDSGKPSGVLFLNGTLGAGKTTLSRGLIQALGHQGPVKSPTYTLVEDYALEALRVCHFDLYRLGDPEELEFMGIRDYLDEQTLCLFEWPDKGLGILPPPDLIIDIEDLGEARRVNLSAQAANSKLWITQLESD